MIDYKVRRVNFILTIRDSSVEARRFILTMRNAQYAYDYAQKVLNTRFIEAESIIATSAHYSFCYARNVIQGPFLEGEKAIASNPYYSYAYAKEIKHCVFQEGEKAIVTVSALCDSYREFIMTLCPQLPAYERF